ncbi:MAG: hypothetical protein AAB229_08025 [Candidatus Hydrogenedentota bacterium]
MKKILMIGSLMLLASCTPGVTVSRVGNYAPPRNAPPTNVDVYHSKAEVTRPYKEIAVLTADDAGWDYHYDVMEDMIVKRAKQLGAQGVIFGRQQEEGAEGGYTIRGAIVVPKVGQNLMQGTAIVYQ